MGFGICGGYENNPILSRAYGFIVGASASKLMGALQAGQYTIFINDEQVDFSDLGAFPSAGGQGAVSMNEANKEAIIDRLVKALTSRGIEEYRYELIDNPRTYEEIPVARPMAEEIYAEVIRDFKSSPGGMGCINIILDGRTTC